ncbi:DUF5050 domain-containing protein [Clostridium sp.]|uniref:DUF5050 domain-containing protein n=1 Tax=Clostridium sp. TaxID=1506 RepID=UPI0035A0165E
MNKVKMLVITSAVILGTSCTVKAVLPANSIVVGSNVYNLTYLTTHSGVMQTVNDEIMNNLGSIYYVGSDGNAMDIFTGSTVSDSQIAAKSGNTLTYTTQYGTTQKILEDASGEFQTPTDQNSTMYAIANINYKQLSAGFYVFNFKVNQLTGVSNAAYFRASNSGLVSLTDTATYVGALSSGDQIHIYASDGITELAFGTIGLSTSGDTTGQQNLNITLTSTAAADPDDDSIKGNTAVNIVNTGFAAVDENNQWIYYSNTADKNKLYKQNVTGVDNYVISDDNVKYINVVGDWVYYSNYDDNGAIYKVRTDGTQRQKLNDNMASYINVIGSKIYYINNSDRARIYVLDSQGEKQLIGDSASALSVTGNFLFYINQSDSNKLYSYNISNATKSKISDVKTKFINATSDYLIFYTGLDGVLYRSTNSAGQTAIPMSVVTNIAQKASSTGTSYKSTSDILTILCALDDDNIYYTSNADKGKIYRLDQTGNGYKLVDDSADYMNIINSTLYYIKNGKAYTASLNGSSSKKGTAVKKPKLTVKVSSIEPLPSFTTSDINTFSFPDRVSCIMSDGNIQEIVVNWDKTIPSPKKGVYTFKGTLLGYGNKVNISVVLDSGTIDVTNNNVVVTNNVGSTDTVAVSNLTPGDIIGVYNDYTATKALKSATADANGNVNITGLNLDSSGGYLYLTITKSGKAEGQKITVPYGPEAPTNFTIDAQNGKITGLKSGYKYKVYLDSKDSSGKLPSISSANLLNSTPLSVDPSGTISIDLKTPIGNSTSLMLRLVAVSDTTSASSNPSAAVEVGKQVVPEYVSTDLNLGRITGTTNSMQYSYDGSTGWTDCTNGTTPISMTRSLQVFVKVKANGPYLESESKQLPLFPAPVVTGITNGSTYATAPTIGWPVDDADQSDLVTTKYSLKLEKVTVDSSGNNVYSVISLGTLSGNSLDLSNILALQNPSLTGDNYRLTATATRNIYSTSGATSPTQTADANTIISFTLSSAKPAPVDITFIETPGTKDNSGNLVTTDPFTYYQATPTWSDLAGTYSSSTITMTKTVLGTAGNVTYTDVILPAEVAFVKRTTITQNGQYKLKIITTNRENGATTETTKIFNVESIDKALSPTVTNITEGGVYTSLASGISIVDRANCTTKSTIMREGYITEYTPNTVLTVNGNYVLILNTTNNINGAIIEKKVSFTINSGSTIPTGVNFDFGTGILSGVTTDEEYSLNGGGLWASVTSSGNQTLTSAEINTLNNDSNNKILVRYRANGSTPASSSQIITLTKPTAPSGITFSFDGTDAGKLKNATTDMEYSLDAGNSWTAITVDSPDLSSEISSITASNDIRVRTKAAGTNKASDPQIIDIVQASPPSVTSSIDLTGNITITGTTSAMEYSNDGGSSWTDALSTISIPSMSAGSTIQIRNKASGTAMAGNPTAITVQAAPAAGIDYSAETITGVTNAMEWSEDGGSTWTDVSGTSIDLSGIIPASGSTTVYVRNKATSTTLGLSKTVTVPAKPAKPTASNVTIQAGSSGKTSINVGITLEYRIVDSTGNTVKQAWKEGTGSAEESTVTVSTGDKVQVRVKATGSSFASDYYEHELVSGEIGS